MSYFLLFSSASLSLSPDDHLTNYWPISNGQMNDLVGNANMQQGASTTFTTDRFGNPNSALNLNGGWTRVPAGVYFNAAQFSITVWIYPQTVGYYARLIGTPLDNILVAFDTGNNNKPELAICPSTGCPYVVASTNTLALNQWQFLVSTFDGAYLKIYINNTMTGSVAATYSLPNLNRANNYIGQSCALGGNGYSYTYIDDLRFYNISLNITQLHDLMGLDDLTTSTTTTTTSTTTTSTTTTTTSTFTTSTSTTTTTFTTTTSTSIFFLFKYSVRCYICI